MPLSYPEAAVVGMLPASASSRSPARSERAATGLVGASWAWDLNVSTPASAIVFGPDRRSAQKAAG